MRRLVFLGLVLMASSAWAGPLDRPLPLWIPALWQIQPPPVGGISVSSGGTFSGGTITSPILAANGAASAPSYSFTASTSSGMYWNGNVVLDNGNTNFLSLSTTQIIAGLNGSAGTPALSNANFLTTGLYWAAGPILGLSVNAGTSQLQLGSGTDSAPRLFGGTAPTISSGFGTTPGAPTGVNGLFQLTVGTGGTATTGVVAFHGTWTTAPFCFVNDETTTDAVPTHAVATTTQVTLSISTAWAASTKLDVYCWSN